MLACEPLWFSARSAEVEQRTVVASFTMYNGIGLLTPRGSGTSGHVTSNSFNIRPGDRGTERRPDATNKPIIKKPDERILEHQRKREIEVKLMELEETLQEQGCAPEHTNCAAEQRTVRAAIAFCA